MTASLGRKATAEAVGTALLVAVVVGSGIFAQRLSPDDAGLQLLETSTATAGGLVALILAFGSVSGAHLNPVVTLAALAFGGLTARDTIAYIPAQIVGGLSGAVVANVMFDLDPIRHLRRDHTVVGAGLHRRADPRGWPGRRPGPLPPPHSAARRADRAP